MHNGMQYQNCTKPKTQKSDSSNRSGIYPSTVSIFFFFFKRISLDEGALSLLRSRGEDEHRRLALTVNSLGLLASVLEDSSEAATNGAALVTADASSGEVAIQRGDGLSLKRMFLGSGRRAIGADCTVLRAAGARESGSAREATTSATDAVTAVRVVVGGDGERDVAMLGDRRQTARAASWSSTAFKPSADKVVDGATTSTSSKVLASLELGGRLGLQLIESGWSTRLTNGMLTRTSLSGTEAGGSRDGGLRETVRLGEHGRLWSVRRNRHISGERHGVCLSVSTTESTS